MDALQMLREDHRKVKELFRQFEEAEDRESKKAIFDTIYMELEVHSKLEEELFYPAVRRQGNSTEMVRQAEEEHALVDQLLKEILSMDPGDLNYDAKFHILKDNVDDHIQEEESEMLPQAAEVGLAQLERLGERMAQRKAELAESRPRAATRPRRATSAGTRTKGGVRRAGSTTRAAGRTSRAARGTSRPSRATTPRSRNGSSAAGTESRTTKTKRASAETRKPSASRKTTAGRTRSRPAGRRSGSESGR